MRRRASSLRAAFCASICSRSSPPPNSLPNMLIALTTVTTGPTIGSNEPANFPSVVFASAAPSSVLTNSLANTFAPDDTKPPVATLVAPIAPTVPISASPSTALLGAVGAFNLAAFGVVAANLLRIVLKLSASTLCASNLISANDLISISSVNAISLS